MAALWCVLEVCHIVSADKFFDAETEDLIQEEANKLTVSRATHPPFNPRCIAGLSLCRSRCVSQWLHMRERQPPEGIGAPLAPGAVDLQGLQNGLAGLTGLPGKVLESCMASYPHKIAYLQQ